MIQIVRGDTPSISVNVTDKNGPFNLEGYEAFFTCKITPDDPNPLISIKVSEIPTPALGIVVIPFLKENTTIKSGKYIYEIKIVSEFNAFTLKTGNLVIAPSLTTEFK